MIQETEEERFLKELLRKGLADRTIREYMIRFKSFPKDVPLTEQVLYDYLDQHSGSIAHAFVKIYADIHNLKDFKLPVRTGRKPQRIPKIMTEEEYRKLRIAMYKRNVKYGLLTDISYCAGLRREEATNLTYNNFMFDQWEGRGKPCRIKFIGKGNKERIAPVPAWLMDTLIRYLDFMNENYALGENEPIFKIKAETWGQKFTEMSERILGKKYTTHHLRHTRTVLWRKAGVTIDQVSKRLGHSSISTTQRYWNLDMSEVLDTWEKEL
jgi:integrase/recombinase XerC